MRPEDNNLIPALPLVQNFLVFAAYGFIVGLGTRFMSNLKFDLSKAEELMMEPLSFYSFSALCIVGMFGLTVCNFFAKSAKGMRSLWIVRNIFVPISNAGLCSGAIIMGMMVGMALGLLEWNNAVEVRGLIKSLFGMSVVISAVFFPILIFMRSMFDLSSEAQQRFTMFSTIYGGVAGLVLWYQDKEKFWLFVGATGAICLGIIVLGAIMQKQAQRRSSQKYRAGFK